jgi:hypothetical protein
MNSIQQPGSLLKYAALILAGSVVVVAAFKFPAYRAKSSSSQAIILEIGNTLKDPESARYRFNMTNLTADGGRICGFYNAKNSFGAYQGEVAFDYYVSLVSSVPFVSPWEAWKRSGEETERVLHVPFNDTPCVASDAEKLAY